MGEQGGRCPHVSHEDLSGFLELPTSCAIKACSALRYDFYNPRDLFSVLLLYGAGATAGR
jgi:hypothetical protein